MSLMHVGPPAFDAPQVSSDTALAVDTRDTTDVTESAEDRRIRELRAAVATKDLDELARLSQSPDSMVRALVARLPKATPAILARLARDVDVEVRRTLLRNPSLPKGLTGVLARDQDASIRELVASNPSTPPHFLALLADDPHEDVRIGLATNPSAPEEVLRRLLVTATPFVAGALLGNDAISDDFRAEIERSGPARRLQTDSDEHLAMLDRSDREAAARAYEQKVFETQSDVDGSYFVGFDDLGAPVHSRPPRDVDADEQDRLLDDPLYDPEDP